MPLLRLDPTDWDHWRGDMMRMWNRFTPDGWTLGNQPAYWVIDAGDHVLAELEIPGVDPKGVELDVDDQTISVRGQWPGLGIGLETGRRQGEFSLTLALPAQVSPDRATAEFHHGLLRVEMPKAVGPRRRLDIRVPSGSLAESAKPM